MLDAYPVLNKRETRLSRYDNRSATNIAQPVALLHPKQALQRQSQANPSVSRNGGYPFSCPAPSQGNRDAPESAYFPPARTMFGTLPVSHSFRRRAHGVFCTRTRRASRPKPRPFHGAPIDTSHTLILLPCRCAQMLVTREASPPPIIPRVFSCA